MKSKEEIVLLELYNQKDTDQRLWLEPWCEELELPAGASWKLTAVALGPLASTMVTIEFQEDQVVIYGITNAVMRLYAEDELVWECFKPLT